MRFGSRIHETTIEYRQTIRAEKQSLILLAMGLSALLLFSLVSMPLGKILADQASVTSAVPIDFVYPEDLLNSPFEKQAMTQDTGLSFIMNEGQLHTDVRYYTETFAGRVYVTDEGLTYDLQTGESTTAIAIKESFVSANPLQPDGYDQSQAVMNYLVGEESNWKSNISSFNKVSFGQVWEGVNVDLKANNNNVEKVFTVAPGADVRDIQLAFEGITGLSVNSEGELVLATELGTVSLTKPLAYQEIGMESHVVEISYAVIDGEKYGFTAGAGYDPNYPLIIDPLLASTYLGGTDNEGQSTLTPLADDEDMGIAFDSLGNVFIAGLTSGTADDYPATVGPYGSPSGTLPDVVVSKFNSDLTLLLASAVIGGSDLDEALAIVVNPNNDDIFITGRTNSTNFPTAGSGVDTTYNGGTSDIFVSRLPNNLSSLDRSTFIGGNNTEQGRGIALSGTGFVYVVGNSFSPDYPTTAGAYDDTADLTAGADAIVTRLNFELSITRSTWLGGTNDSVGRDIVIQSGTGDVFVTGFTLATNFPITSGAHQMTKSGANQHDAFIARFDSDLSSLSRSTYLGAGATAGEHTTPFGIAFDPSGNVVVAGYTQSDAFPTTLGAYDTTREVADEDAFISRLSPDLQTLQRSTVIGGAAAERIRGLAVAGSGDVYVIAFGGSYPTTPGAFNEGANDAYVSKFDNDLSTLMASTSLGGSNTDALSAIGLSSGDVYVAGWTRSTNFPTTAGAYDTTKAGVPGSFDFIVSKLTANLAADPQISIEFVSNLTPKFDVDEVFASGLVINDSPGDFVEVSWGDGEVTQITPLAGAWGPVSHIYGSAAIGQNTIQPFLHYSGNVAEGSFANIVISPHSTTFLMNDIGSPAADTPLTVSGILLDADTGAQLPEGQEITFTGNGATGVSTVTTEGITIDDPLGVTIEACSACIPDLEGATENMLLRLNVGGTLQFAAGTQSVQLEIQDTGTDVFTFEVAEFGNPTPFTTDSFGTAPDQTNLFISAPNGIASLELVSTSGSAVGISSITTSNPENTPQEMIHADLENLGEGIYSPSLTLESGAFFARATSFNTAQMGLDVRAEYGGSPLYTGTISSTQVYDIVDRTWGAAGDPTSFTVDSGTGINTIKCATDADGDGLCATPDNTGIITYAGANYDLCSFECPAGESQKDVYVEIDSMASHVPPQAAIDNVIAAFAAVPNGDLPLPRVGTGITLHVELDNSLTHSNLIEVWKDGTADNAQDDFEDIKANNFGTATERGGGLLAANDALRAKAEVYHYGISVHGIGGACNAATPSGIGETPGNDFVISLGCGFNENNSGHSGTEGDQNEFEGTMMHELGHNVNLGHGGPKEFRELPNGNSLTIPGSPYAVTDSSGTTRAFTVAGFQVDTDVTRTGTVILPVNVFTSDPGATTVSSITQSGDGADIAINTKTAFVSGTGNSRLVTLKVTWTTSGDVTPVADGGLGTFTVNLNIVNTGATMPTPTTPAVGPQLKINVGSNADLNCKVNYQSVMSYPRQFDTYLGAYYVLDYSRAAIAPAVDEAASNIEDNYFTSGGAGGSKLVNAYTSGANRAYFVNTYPDVNWDGDGNPSESAATGVQDSNNFGITGCGASANSVQRGYDDWANVQLDFKEGIGSFDGSYTDPRQLLEITGQINGEMITQVDDSTTTTTANPPGGFYNTAQSVELTADGAATIHYTTDGTTPDENSPEYSGHIPISTTTTLLFFSISDASGNPEQLRMEVYNFDDTTPPEITIIGDIEDGEQFFFGSVPPEPTCTAIDTGSGVNSDGCVVTGYGTSVGSHTLVFTAEDNAGNEATVEINYTVDAWTLLGFYSPTDMPPTVNVVNAGRTVPLKFEVFAGSTELTDVSVVDTLKSFKVSCDPQAPTDPVDETMASPGGTVLRYEDGQFVYNWKTPTTKACYDVVLTLDDGSSIMAHFKTQ